MFKSITQDTICFDYLFRIISNVWSNEECPSQWDIGRLVILPKKGDLSKPGNYRGIMLLEIAYKIVAIVINKRLQPLIERLDHENQCGFRRGRGCPDAVFIVQELDPTFSFLIIRNKSESEDSYGRLSDYCFHC